LPIDDALPDVLAALRTAGAVVLRAPTGAGKTTRVPPAVLDAGLAGRGSIVVLQPRRLAARASARRMAVERGGRLGDEVGYHVRFDRCLGPHTRIKVVTEGILLCMLQDDPFLESVAVVVFDEFHERNLNSDLALAMVRRVRETVRPDLKLVVMSATLDGAPIAAYVGGCPRVESEGRLHPVETLYVDLQREPHAVASFLADRAAEGVRRMLEITDGDVLVFLPGVGEIRQTARRLEPLAAAGNLAVMPLYGDLPAEQQDAVLAPADRRKIVLATNVAETSITIEGITGVVDTGLARMLVFDPHVGMDRLELTRISQAAADQRAGRAGRTRPGVCLRLWPERTHRLRPPREEPEVRRLDLAGPVLQLRAWGETDVRRFPWFEPPSDAALEQAEALLRRLDAIDADGRPTGLGRTMARLPVGPRLGRMLLEGRRLGQPAAVALAAALLSERDPFRGEGDGAEAGEKGTGTFCRNGPKGASHKRRLSPFLRPRRPTSNSDVLDRVAAIEAFEETGRLDGPLGYINRAAARFVLHVRDQLLRELRRMARAEAAVAVEEAVARALLAAFPDRLVRRSNPGSPFGRMVGGRGVRLAESSAVRDASLLLAVDVDRGKSEALVRQASAVDRAWLPAEHLAIRTEVEFDPQPQRVIARRRVYWEDLLLEETPAALPDGDAAAGILAAAAAESFDAVFPWDDPVTADYVNRLRCLAAWMPELELPALDAAGLRALLPLVCRGCRSFDEVRKAPWLAGVQGLLAPQQRQAVEREAPERIEVPSGSRIKLHYEPGKPPVLAVRIQEVFGLLETPRIARGRVAVLMHLLAPNMRPQQITDDLANFWKTTYHQVRKDLRRRYPKHAWPEDPYQATAERRPKRKGG
jgi:ATP-dependent helicase HrpB